MPVFILQPTAITGKYLESSMPDPFPIGTVQIYVGRLLVGHCEPCRGIDKYDFHSYEEPIVDKRKATIEEIQEHVELSLKEYATKFIKGVAAPIVKTKK